jgi:hypothetical protein
VAFPAANVHTGAELPSHLRGDDVTSEISEVEIQRLRAENAELRRLLAKHQWAGLTPIGSHGVCPECSGSIYRGDGTGHRPGCAIAAVLGETTGGG